MSISRLINHAAGKVVESWGKDNVCTGTCESLWKGEADPGFVMPERHTTGEGGSPFWGQREKSYSLNRLQLKYLILASFTKTYDHTNTFLGPPHGLGRGLMQMRGPEM